MTFPCMNLDTDFAALVVPSQVVVSKKNQMDGAGNIVGQCEKRNTLTLDQFLRRLYEVSVNQGGNGPYDSWRLDVSLMTNNTLIININGDSIVPVIRDKIYGERP